jgi:hypothetical protein
MDFWNWKSSYVMIATIKWMDFGLVLLWTSKTFKELVLFLNVIMKSSLKWFDSYLMNFMLYGLWFGEKHAHFFKSPFYLERKHDLFWKIASMFLINKLYKNKSFNGKKSLGLNALLLPNYKKHFEAQKNTKEMDFQICKFLPFLVRPIMHLPLC